MAKETTKHFIRQEINEKIPNEKYNTAGGSGWSENPVVKISYGSLLTADHKQQQPNYKTCTITVDSSNNVNKNPYEYLGTINLINKENSAIIHTITSLRNGGKRFIILGKTLNQISETTIVRKEDIWKLSQDYFEPVKYEIQRNNGLAVKDGFNRKSGKFNDLFSGSSHQQAYNNNTIWNFVPSLFVDKYDSFFVHTKENNNYCVEIEESTNNCFCNWYHETTVNGGLFGRVKFYNEDDFYYKRDYSSLINFKDILYEKITVEKYGNKSYWGLNSKNLAEEDKSKYVFDNDGICFVRKLGKIKINDDLNKQSVEGAQSSVGQGTWNDGYKKIQNIDSDTKQYISDFNNSSFSTAANDEEDLYIDGIIILDNSGFFWELQEQTVALENNTTIIKSQKWKKLTFKYNDKSFTAKINNDYVQDGLTIKKSLENYKFISSRDYFRKEVNSNNFSFEVNEHSQENTNDEEINEIIKNGFKENSNYFVTPSEFYSQNEKTNIIEKTTDGSGLYVSEKTEIFENKSTWFWIESLKNWATFRREDENNYQYVYKLCLWDGFSKFIPLNSMINSVLIQDKQTYDRELFAKEYLYDLFKNIHLSMSGIFTYYGEQQIEVRTILLPLDGKFSQNDSNTYQTIRISQTNYYSRKLSLVKNYYTTSGCPMVFRTQEGQLAIMYYLWLPGAKREFPVIFENNIEFLNTICKNFFGDGNDKTIKDHWKNFDGSSNDQEEKASEIFQNFDETLFNAAHINVIDINKDDNLKIKISTNNIKLETNGFTNQGIADRWDR